MSDDTIEVPTEPLIEHIVTCAREFGTLDDYASPPERGVDKDVDWSFEDVDWEIEPNPEDNELLIRGVTSGTYSVQTHSATRWDPPAYETRETELGIDIHVDLDGGNALELGDFHIEVIGL
jgi:hypothetical protein